MALTQEFKALYTNNLQERVHLPKEKDIIGYKWMYKIKHKANGGTESIIVKLVVKGYTQQAHINYIEAFSPVAKNTVYDFNFFLIVKNGRGFYQLKFKKSFLLC